MLNEQNRERAPVNKTLLILLIATTFLLGYLTNGLIGLAKEKPQISPGDHITEEQMLTYETEIIIRPNRTLQYGIYTNTQSMLPTLTQGHLGVEIIPENPGEIEIGDIISFKYKNDTIVHRVIDIGKDEFGVFWETRGDNNAAKDPIKIRYKQITGIVVGVIY